MWKSEGHGLELNYKIQNLTNVKQGFLFVDFNFFDIENEFFSQKYKNRWVYTRKNKWKFFPKTIVGKMSKFVGSGNGQGGSKSPYPIGLSSDAVVYKEAFSIVVNGRRSHPFTKGTATGT